MITNTLNTPHIPSARTNNPMSPSSTPADLPRQKSPKQRNHHQPLIPGLPYNPGVDRYVSRATDGFKTASQSTSQIIREELKKRWGKDIDPDNTFITTFDYDPKLPKPKGGKVLNQISLTDAALHNMRHKNKHNEHETPEEKKQSTLHKWINRLAPLAAAPIAIYNIIHKLNEPKTYEGIFTGPPLGGRQVYNQTTQLKQTPAAFRDITWNTDQSKPYTEFLNGFWPAHEQRYAQLSKAAFAGAAMAQFDNDSLSESDVGLAMRAAGLPTNKTWGDMSLNDLDAAPHKDPNVETGLLKINGFKSTDLMYITDKQTKTTLLHIPGNSSPIHRFDNQDQMKNWLAEQAADPRKREALSMHFPLRDQADRVLSEGVNQTLVGISGWPKKDAPGATALERLNQYDPQTFITTEPLSEDPFKAMTTRQKERSYADGETQITTDADVTKTSILEALETATKIAVMMTPLALVMPEVAVALEVFYAAAGAAQVGIGADNIKHGKQGGSDQVVFGVLNALPALASGASRVLKGAEATEAEVGKTIEESVETPAQQPREPRPHSSNTPEPTDEPILDAPKVDYSKIPIDISKYAVPDGEQLLNGARHNAKGIYQVKNNGEDRWFIRYTDATGQPKVYEVRSNFDLHEGRVMVIAPQTRTRVMLLRATQNGEWTRDLNTGGARTWPWQKKPPIVSEKTPKPGAPLEPAEAGQKKFSDQFTPGTPIDDAKRFDEYLTFHKDLNYTYSGTNYISNPTAPLDEQIIKTRLEVSWPVEESEMPVLSKPSATKNQFSSDPYAEIFIKDTNRADFKVHTIRDGSVKTEELASNSIDVTENVQDKINQFERIISDAQLRARISEVANQNAWNPIEWTLKDDARLTDDYYFKGQRPQYDIYYDPTSKQTVVTGTCKGYLANPELEINEMPNTEVTLTRSFTITASTTEGKTTYTTSEINPATVTVTVMPAN